MRKTARFILTIAMIVSFGFTVFNLNLLWRNPTVTLLVERAKDDLAISIEKQLSAHVSLESIELRLSELLDEQPRNWLAIEAVEGIAVDQGIVIGSDLQTRRDAAYDEEHGFLIATGKCLACAWNPASCDLSAILLCRAPVDLTPVGDIVGVIRESKHYVFGEEVDMFELGLSTVGLASAVLIPITGGTSASIKIGASIAKTARRMGRISDPLLRLMQKTFRESIDWNIVANSSFGNYSSDITRAINPEAIKPVMTIIEELGSIRTSVGVPDALQLLRNIDTPHDARAIARVADVTGSRTVGIFEVLGQNRVIRSTMRYGDEIIAGIAGVFGMLAALLGLLISFFSSLSIRVLRSLAKPKPS